MNKDIYVSISFYIYNLDIMNGSKVIYAYLSGIAKNQLSYGKKSALNIKTSTIAKQLNFSLRSTQLYLKELIDKKHIIAKQLGKYRTLQPAKTFNDAYCIITSDILKKSWNVAYKIAHGILVVKGLKTETHSFNFNDIDSMQTHFNKSRASIYRYIKFLKENNAIKQVNRFEFKSLDAYSKQQHDIIDKEKNERIARRQKLLDDYYEETNNLSVSRNEQINQALDKLYARIR